eukprot:TRINITY_DN5060_c0_g3_i1.p1 TRINITY_DN5060_c0_g3~~TRINITY_DN5060_c0_g3_i1.p1  ORF type:complete len:323 (+),score=59.88 TRINITY_DN5060_c0_g3_i1:240-1208(+)
MDCMRVLVFGCTGMIGYGFCKTLLSIGSFKVTGFSRGNNKLLIDSLEENASFQHKQFDVMNPGDLDDFIPEADIAFITLWERTTRSSDNRELIWEHNVHSICFLTEYLAKKQINIINASTLDVYGANDQFMCETSLLRPTLLYGEARVAQENIIVHQARIHHISAINLRIAFSNSKKRGIVRKIAEKIFHRESLGSKPDFRFQVISLESVVDILIQGIECLNLVSKGDVEAINCCGEIPVSYVSLADEILLAFRKISGDSEIGEVIFDCESGGSDASILGCTEKMRSVFGGNGEKVERSRCEIVKQVVEDIIENPGERSYMR